MTKRTHKNDSGASLILVIVCMLFVGIIAAAVLTLTTGNINSTKSTEASNDNFYGAESILDDLKVYLQKIANKAATDAYAQTIDDVAAGTISAVSQAQYEKHYKEKLGKYIKEELASGGDLQKLLAAGNADKSKFADLGISGEIIGDAKTVSISIGDFDDAYDLENSTLKNIKILFTDGTNYTTSIDTDLQFGCKMPEFTYSAARNEFKYNVDKFIVVTNGNIDTNAGVSEKIIGNIYAGKDIKLSVDSTPLSLYSQYIVSGGSINVERGQVNFNGLAAADTSPIKFVDLDASKADATAVSGADDAEMWIDGIELSGDGSRFLVYDNGAKMYVKDDLSLNGKNSKFQIVNSGAEYYGMSDDTEYASRNSSDKNTSSGTADLHSSSSGIIINGVGASLDMGNASTVVLPGTAYTQVPSIAGATPAEECSYFVQGESVTFKSLQSVYLVPGELIKINGEVVGHNPISEDEIPAGKTIKDVLSVEEPSMLTGKLKSGTYLVSAVKYTSSATQTYFYIYWDFQDTSDAVEFFNDLVNSSNTGNKLSVIKSQIGMLGSGSIDMPSANLYSKGAVIEYDAATGLKIASGEKLSTSDSLYTTCTVTYKDTYNKILSSLGKKSMGVSDNIFDTIFASGDLNSYVPSSGYVEYKLDSPLEDWSTVDAEYSDNSLVMDDASKDYEYYLVIGDVSSYTFDSGKKYIVISPDATNKVYLQNFYGIVFAKGDVLFGSSGVRRCFGNVQTTIKAVSTGEESTVCMSEFDALLNRVVNNDSLTKADGSDNGNSILRSIFGLAHGGASMGGSNGKADSIASVDTINYKKN